MEGLVNWLHERGAVLLGNRDSFEDRKMAELDLLSVACDADAAPIGRVIAYRYLSNPSVRFVDADTAEFLADFRASSDPRDVEIIAEAEKR